MSSRVQANLLKIFLVSISLITGLSIDIYLPSLNAIQAHFDASYSAVQLTMSIYLAGFAIGQLVWGALSDWIGRVKILSMGLIFYLFSTLLCLIANSIEILILARFLQALAASCVPVSSYAIARDMFDGKERRQIYSYMSSMISLVPIFAPIIGGYLQSYYGWQSCFVFLLITGIIVVLPIQLVVPSHYKSKNNTNTFSFKRLAHDYLNIITNKTFIFCNLALVSAFSSLFAFISNSSHIMIDLMHETPERYPFFITANAVALFAGGTMNRWLNTRFDSISVITFGALLMMTGAMWMLINSFVFPGGVYGFIGSMAVCSFAAAWVIPNAIAESLTPFAECAGSAAALFGFLRYMAAFVVANIVSYFSVMSYISLPISILICSAIIYTSMKLYVRYAADQGETVLILR